MKSFVQPSTLFFGLLLQCINCFTQDASIRVVDRIPFDIHSNSFSQSLGTEKQLVVYSANAEVWLIRPAKAAAIVFEFNKLLPLASWADVDYRIRTTGDSAQWHPLVPASFNISSDSVRLGNIQLSPGQQLHLQFRDRQSNTIIEAYIIERGRIVPVLNSLRQHDTADFEKEHHKSRTLQRHPSPADSGGWLGGNAIIVKPGVDIDLLFAQQDVYGDSILEYCFYDFHTSKQPVWQPTGHVLHLPGLDGNASFVLRLRYKDMPGQASFFVATPPYRYQTPFFRGLLLAIAAALLLGVPVLFYRQHTRRERDKRQKAEQQLTRVNNQLNPHFVFNSLASISGLVRMGNTGTAADYLDVFAGMMRHTMDVADKAMISLASDLDQMEQYLRIEQMRFEFRFCFEISPTLNLNEIQLPPQLLQPSLENAVKHGVAGLRQQGFITLKVYNRGTDLYIVISNNAKNTPGKIRHKGSGYGLQFTRDQVAQLEQLSKHRVKFDLKTERDGAEAIFFFENWLNP